MKKSHSNVVQNVNNFRPFFMDGTTPEKNREAINSLLSPYFVHNDILVKYAIDVLVPEFINISIISNDSWATCMFQAVLKCYWDAKKTNSELCLKGLAFWEEKVQAGLSEYWSAYHLEVDKSDLELLEFKYEVFRTIGMFIEACTQPLLRELLLQVRIIRHRTNPMNNLESLDLGLVVGELFDTFVYPELLAPPPWDIRLNQWRNMAQHHKTRVENDLIIGVYRSNNMDKEIHLTKNDLWESLKKIALTFRILNTARTIFAVDNIEEYSPLINKIVLRDEQLITNIASALATQGFKIIEFNYDDNESSISVKDCSYPPTKERLLHASQFAFRLWEDFPRNKVSVHYHDMKGNLLLTTAVPGHICDQFTLGNISLKEYIEHAEFIASDLGNEILSQP